MKEKEEQKERNLQQICNYIYNHKTSTKADIAYDLHLSFPTVSKYLDILLSLKRIVISDEKAIAVGRPAAIYKFNNTHHVSYGIEILADRINIATIDLYGRILSTDSLKLFFQNTDTYYQTLGNWANNYIQLQPFDEHQILGITIALQGLLSEDNEHMTFSKLLSDSNITRSNFARQFSLPVTLIHDTEAAAIAEAWHHPEVDNAIYLSLNYHMGSAIIINNNAVHSPQLSSGTIEHMTLHENGNVCYCSKQGCAETYCSVSSLVRMSGENLDVFFDKLRNNEQNEKEIWNTYLKDLAVLMDRVRMVFSYQFLLGGLLGNYIIDDDIEIIKKNIVSISTFPDVPPEILKCRYNEKAAMIGAGITRISSYLNSLGII